MALNGDMIWEYSKYPVLHTEAPINKNYSAQISLSVELSRPFHDIYSQMEIMLNYSVTWFFHTTPPQKMSNELFYFNNLM